jgi:hypothetical protein
MPLFEHKKGDYGHLQLFFHFENYKVFFLQLVKSYF